MGGPVGNELNRKSKINMKDKLCSVTSLSVLSKSYYFKHTLIPCTVLPYGTAKCCCMMCLDWYSNEGEIPF